MATPVDICNRALSEIGARATITDIDASTPAGAQCLIWYHDIREQLLRAAPWGFARKTAALTSLGLLTDDPPTSPFPWLAKYEFPTDAIKINYILPPPPNTAADVPVVGNLIVPWCKPSRTNRFIIANDEFEDDDGPTDRKVILANITDAVAVYVKDVTNVPTMDKSFKEAFVALLASKLVQPLTGNVGMKMQYEQLAKMHVDNARAQTANESITTSNHEADWISTRFVGGFDLGTGAEADLGVWYDGYDDAGWSM